MARVLLSAYACEPGRGSEPAVGWNWAAELAELGHEVTVITRAANRAAIESEARTSPRLRFVYYDLPSSLVRWRKGRIAKAIYYVLWQWRAPRWLRRHFPDLPFDLAHHVTYVSARYPSFMGSLGIPLWFGPVSGGEVVPAPLRPGFSAGQRCHEWLRDLSNRLLHIDPLIRLTFRRAERILVTPDTLRLVPKACRFRSTVHLAIGLPERQLHRFPLPKRSAPAMRLLYVGRLVEWKGLNLALRALFHVRERVQRIHFTIAGEGPAERKLRRLAHDLGLENIVDWVGWVPQRMLESYYETADLLLFPSLRDSGGMVVLEALAHGIPVVCTDLGGPGLVVDTSCGRAITTAGRNEEFVARELAEAILEVQGDPALHASLSRGAHARAQQFSFRNMVETVYAAIPAAPTVCQA